MPPYQRPLKLRLSDHAARLSPVVVLALLVWNLGSMAAFMVIGRTPVPLHDQWDDAYFPDGMPGKLFDTHNEHRPALGRLVGWLDWTLVAGGNQINAFFVFLCFPLFGVALYSLSRAAGGGKGRAALIAALALALMTSCVQYENLLWGFQTAFTGSFVFELVALAAAVAAVSGASLAKAWGAFVLCLLASLCAVFSLTSGLVVLPAVMVTLLVTKTSNRMRAAYGLFTAAVIGFYFHNYSGGGDYDRLGALRQLPALALYTMGYLGSALHPTAIPGAALRGGVGLAVLGIVLFNAVLKARANPGWLRSGPGVAYLALILFALGIVAAAGMAGLGRLRLGLEQALSSRYGTVSLAFWADLVVLCLLAGQTAPSRWSSAINKLGWVLGIGLAIHTAATQQNYFTFAHATKADRINGMIAYDLGLREHPAILEVYPTKQAILSGALDSRFEEMRRDRTSIFAQGWPSELGQPIGDWTRGVGSCNGFVEQRRPAAGPRPALWLQGWGWDKARNRTPDLIVFADDNGRTIGFGKPGYRRKDVVKALHKSAARYSGWRGFALATPGQSVRAYAVELDAKPTACLITTSSPAAP